MIDTVLRLTTSAIRSVAGRKPSSAIGARVRRPASVQIKPRRFQTDYKAAGLPRYWVSNDPFLTHFMNALSLSFPEGEQAFVNSVRAVRARVQDESLKKDIVAFMAQEALHSQAHEVLNEYLKSFGYPVDAILKQIHDEEVARAPMLGKKASLALTCALEHITAIMGDLLLNEPDMQAMVPEAIRPLWLWHALEEAEHKAVAFDVYQEVYGDYATRVAFLVIATVGLVGGALSLQRILLKHDGLANNPRVVAQGLRELFGKQGYLTRLIPNWLQYFRPDFHPWQHDNSELVARYRARFEQGYGGVVTVVASA